MHMATMQDVSMRDLPDLLISRGRYSMSLEEIRSLTGLSEAAVASGLQRLRKRRRVFSPTRGLYVVDSSVFPTNLGVNPQHTIMALATLLAERLV